MLNKGTVSIEYLEENTISLLSKSLQTKFKVFHLYQSQADVKHFKTPTLSTLSIIITALKPNAIDIYIMHECFPSGLIFLLNSLLPLTHQH